MATFFCELAGNTTPGSNGSGTDGDPYTSLEFAVESAGLVGGDVLCVRGNNFIFESVPRLTVDEAITIQPDTGFEPSGTGPTLQIATSNRFGGGVDINAAATVDGFRINNANTLPPSAAVQTSGNVGATIRNCELETSGTIVAAVQGGDVIENCLLLAPGTAVQVINFSGSNTGGALIVRNCVLVGAGVAIGIDVPNFRDVDVYSTAFVNCANDLNIDTNPSTIRAFQCATTQATVDADWSATTDFAVNLSTSDGVDFVEPSTGDYRAEPSGILEDTGSTTNSSAADMFGTTRDATPDIGYFEIVAAGGGPSGTLDAVLANDIAAMTAGVSSLALINATLGDDTSQLAAAVDSGALLDANLADDVAAFSALVNSLAVLDATLQDDIAALLATVGDVNTGTLAAILGDDTSIMAASVFSFADLVATLGDDSSQITATTSSSAVLDGQLGDDTSQITAVVGDVVSAVLDASLGNDTSQMTASVIIAATLDATLGDDIAAMTSSVRIAATLDATLGNDTAQLTASALGPIGATLDATLGDDESMLIVSAGGEITVAGVWTAPVDLYSGVSGSFAELLARVDTNLQTVLSTVQGLPDANAIAAAVWSLILNGSDAAAAGERLVEVNELLQLPQIMNPDTSQLEIWNDDITVLLYTAAIFSDPEGTVPWTLDAAGNAPPVLRRGPFVPVP